MNPQSPPGRRVGVVGAWVVVALATLLGMAALVFDLSRTVIAAQRTQDVADAAALAGAWGLPDRHEGTRRLAAIVSANALATPRWPVAVNLPDDVVCYGPGDRLPDGGALRADEYAIQVRACLEVPYGFAAALGIRGVQVSRRSTALSWAAGATGPGPLFAGETRRGVDGIRCSGSDLTVRGTVHSNTEVVITGSGHRIDGDVEFRHGCRINDPSGVRGEIRAAEAADYPVPYTWAQFDAGPWDRQYQGDVVADALPGGRIRVNGDLTLQGSGFAAHDALWVVTGDIRFNGGAVTLDRVTMVAGGTIRFNGSSGRFSSFHDELFAMSLAAAEPAIRINGAGGDTWGVIYAPHGQVEYNGGHQEVHHGAVVALTIDINGSGSVFAGIDADQPHGGRRARLIR